MCQKYQMVDTRVSEATKSDALLTCIQNQGSKLEWLNLSVEPGLVSCAAEVEEAHHLLDYREPSCVALRGFLDSLAQALRPLVALDLAMKAVYSFSIY